MRGFVAFPENELAGLQAHPPRGLFEPDQLRVREGSTDAFVHDLTRFELVVYQHLPVIREVQGVLHVPAFFVRLQLESNPTSTRRAIVRALRGEEVFPYALMLSASMSADR